MIEIRFEERVKIGLQYVLESLHGCSPFGQEKIRRLRFYTPAERAAPSGGYSPPLGSCAPFPPQPQPDRQPHAPARTDTG